MGAGTGTRGKKVREPVTKLLDSGLFLPGRAKAWPGAGMKPRPEAECWQQGRVLSRDFGWSGIPPCGEAAGVCPGLRGGS